MQNCYFAFVIQCELTLYGGMWFIYWDIFFIRLKIVFNIAIIEIENNMVWNWKDLIKRFVFHIQYVNKIYKICIKLFVLFYNWTSSKMKIWIWFSTNIGNLWFVMHEKFAFLLFELDILISKHKIEITYTWCILTYSYSVI